MPRRSTVTNDAQNQQLVVRFKDGSTARLAWDALRDACPCAECRQLHGPRDPLTLVAAPNKQLTAFEYSGNYAVQLIWGDGHRFGIYTWAYLKELADRLAAAKPSADGD